MQQLQLASPSGTESKKGDGDGDWPMAYDTSTAGGSVPTPTARESFPQEVERC
jgi:hypothetical protein